MDALQTRLDEAQRLVAALSRQLGARLIETHISWVLLDGTHAWKIKKPVRLPFLDFSALATRRHLCEEELRLNRRLAPDIYLDVHPITGTPDAPEIDGPGPVIEHALRMRQFADEALLTAQLAGGLIKPQHLEVLAQTLARFHRQAKVAEAGMPWGAPEQVRRATQGVLQGLIERGAGPALAPIAAWLDQQALDLHDTWLARQATGHVVEGHGDLHLANLVVLGDAVTAFDCIEFDAGLRWGDVLGDIAFVVMDLMARGRADLGAIFLNTYLDETGEHEGLPVLRYYLVYRALVRALVARIRQGQSSGPDLPLTDEPDYLALAGQLIQPPDVRLMITHGLSGSGKSFVTRSLLAATQAVRLRSDVERKRLFGLHALDDSAQIGQADVYADEATRRTYARLRELASVALHAGYRVMVDATFLRTSERLAWQQLALQCQVPFAILHCHAPTPVLTQRVLDRSAAGQDASEADLAVLHGQLANAQALLATELACTLDVDTSQPIDVHALAQHWLGMS